MKILNLCAMTALGSCASTLAAAAPPSKSVADEPGFYAGLLASRLNYKEEAFTAVHPVTLALTGGWRFNRYLAFEARLGGGIVSDTLYVPVVTTPEQPLPDVPVELKVRSYFSALLQGTLPINDHFNIYAAAGLTRANFSASVPGYSLAGSDNGFSYAGGVEFRMGASHSALHIEAGRLLAGTGYNADAISIGFRHNF